jgi:uncharacterized membrane protein YeaQ/YmgE (transglycosylase-associated protein family)
MASFLWLFIGLFVGLVVRSVIGGKAYGTLVDTLLGMTGAFVADLILNLRTNQIRMSWAGQTTFMIWAAVALPLLARFLAKRQALRKANNLASKAVCLKQVSPPAGPGRNASAEPVHHT